MEVFCGDVVVMTLIALRPPIAMAHLDAARICWLPMGARSAVGM